MSGDSVVISSVAYPDPRKLALVADMQYHEPYTSAALNRKLRGILREGFYTGFIPRPGGGLNLLVTSVDSEQKTGSASINIGDDYQITVRQQKDVILKLSAGTKFAIILKAVYTLGSDTYQVNSKSSIKATEIYAKTFTDSYELGDGELLICTVNIPAGAKEITIDMIDSTAKKVAAIGIELSNDFNSDEEKKAATPKAVKDGIADHEQKADPHSQYAMKESPVLTGIPEAPTASAGSNTNQIANTAFVQAVILGLIGGSPETLSTLKKIADAINNDPNFSTTISNELALKAPLDSPSLTGTPSAPTAPEDTNNTQIATTAFVRRAISALVGSAPETLDTINEIATALGNDPNFATTMLNALGGKQPLDNTLTNLSGKDVAGLLAYLGLGETINLAAGAMQKSQNGADIPDTALFRQSIGIYDASTSQKGLVRLNGGVTDESNETAATSGAVKVAYDAAIAAADIAKTKWSAVDATISQKGIVMLSDNTGVPDSTTAATTTAVNYVLNQAAAAYSLAESKYTAGGATTGKAGLVQLVNSMGGSGSLVMPQAAVTTAIQNYPSLGKGQNLQDLRGSRSIDATYTNSTGFPIAVYVRIAGGTSANLYVHVNGIEFGGGGSIASNTSIATAFFIVPNGATYRVIASGSSIALQAWSELR
ncbi:hypothetical protein J3676_004229 [Salmonella enterica subsp. enterica serovar Stanley]|nr:hypothetical protein [Salmonella enterica subsp. enterica serovar Stanley]